MNKPEEKIYVPRSMCKLIETRSKKQIMKISVHADSLIEFLKKHKNARGYVNFGVTELKAEGRFGQTHCMWLDTWTPEGQPRATQQQTQQGFANMRKATAAAPPSTPAEKPQDDQEDVPF